MAKKDYKASLLTAAKYPKKNPVKCVIVAVFLLLALIGLLLSKRVQINYSLSDYLGKDTETSIALEIMTDEFGTTGNVQVMLSGIDKETAKGVKEELSAIEGALNVSFDEDSPSSYIEESKTALFTVLINGEDHSETAKAVIEEIKTTLGDKYGAVELGGSTVEYNVLRENTSGEMGLIIVLSVALAAVLLLITSSSWIEPIILLGCSGIAIGINMGLNIFLGEISYITKSVSSILQLALSVDYSIVLIHAYRDEKKNHPNNTAAMRSAVKAVLNPVSASALTTIAGLVALLFMSFKIGFDIGIVLIKGIVVSAITAMTFLPVVVLMLDDLIKKTAKRPFVPKGEFFAGFATRFSKLVAPAVAVLIILGAVLQSFNGYGFTDSIGANKKIESTFGRSDTIVIVYPHSSDGTSVGEDEDYAKEMLLKEALYRYTNTSGENPVTSYTAHATTVRELYDLKKAVKTLGLAENDVKMLFAMYNIYKDNSALELTPYEFIRYTNELLNSGDKDVTNLVDEGTKKTIGLLNSVADVSRESYTVEELIAKFNEISPDSGISEFAIRQMYGLYFYDKIADKDKTINTHALCTYLIQNINSIPIDETKKPVFNFALNNAKNKTDANQALNYADFCNFIKQSNFSVDFINAEMTQQLYIMYLTSTDVSVGEAKLSECRINGKEFVNFVLATKATNPTVASQLTADISTRLGDLSVTTSYLEMTEAFSYVEMTDKMNELKSKVQSMSLTTKLQKDKISGVYIKYGAEFETEAAMKPMQACDLVSFIKVNMYTSPLLSSKMTEEHFNKIVDAEEMMAGARELFLGREYSRILVSAKLPAEGPEMVAFIDYLLENVKDIFGEDAHITGKVVSTYDLQAAFDKDNLVITLFTIISILLVILCIFKSVSLPVILVAVIQGSVWISLSLCLIGGNLIFFMSYIVTTCILMGATVDYGILMSNNYIVFRKTMDRKEALRRAVDSAMPTVFTSGLILVVCGIIISIISSQNSIASVGTLIAQGTVVSIIMITLGLPSLLYLLDKIILRFTMNDKQKAVVKAKFDEWLLKFKATKVGGAIFKVLEKIHDVLMIPFQKIVEEKRKMKLKAERLKRAKEKRAITNAAKKKAKEEAAALAPKQKAPRKTARSIMKEMSEAQAALKAKETPALANTMPEETKAEELKAEEVKIKEIKAEEAKAEEVKIEEIKAEESAEQVKADVPAPEKKPAPKKTASTKQAGAKAASAKSTTAKTATSKAATSKTTATKTSATKTAATKAAASKTSAKKPAAAKTAEKSPSKKTAPKKAEENKED